jgi:hypothetical protein
MKANPGAVESHWMPTDMHYYQVENYEQFLGKRRELLAENANQFLNSLINDSITELEIQDYVNRTVQDTSFQDEENSLLEVNAWMKGKGLTTGVIDFELTDEKGTLLMIIDLAWPQGIQSELSEPLALLVNEDDSNKEVANRNGYKYFTSPEEFKSYVEAHYVAD